MVLLLDDETIERVLDLETLVPAVEDALVRQTSGAVERPARPHFPVGSGPGEDAPGTALIMPAAIHGAPYFGTKLASIHPENPARDLPTLHAQLVLSEAATGRPVAVMDARRLTNARTGCIGGLAARELAEEPITLGVLGAGAQARWQTRAIAALTDVDAVRVYSPSDSKHACVEVLRDEGLPATAVESARAAVAGATVVVTATTSTEPVFPADALEPGALVVAIGAYDAEMQELEPEVIRRATRVFADVPAEAIATGDLVGTGHTVDDLVSMGTLFGRETGRRAAEELLVVESVGSAVLDIAAATVVYEAALDAGVGSEHRL